MMMRRRRPLARAAMVGGAAYYAGKRARSGSSASRIRSTGSRSWSRSRPPRRPAYGAPPPAYGAPPPAAPQGGGGLTPEAMEQLQQLAQLKEQGVLTDEEFDAQKRKILGG